MADVLWGGLQNDKATVHVTAVGSMPGPGGGDGWTIVGRLPKAKLAANKHYAFIVTGHVQNVAWTGTMPQRGIVQVCLGSSAGTKHPEYRMQLSLASAQYGTYVAQPFQFLVLFSASPSITDPLWGATWPNSDDLVLWARIYRNGDPANYAGSFDVSTVSWLWWDLDAIPSNCQLAEQHYPATPDLLPALGSSPGGWLTTNNPGSSGQTWLHFSNLWFTPRGNGAGPARFEHGYVTDGTFSTFAAKGGTGLRWGTDTRGTYTGVAGVEEPTQQLGSFWPQTQPAGSFLLGYRGVDAHAVSGRRTLVHRWRYLGIRIDQLPEARALSLTNGSAGANIAAHLFAYPTVFAPWEPGAQTGLVAEPVVLAHGILGTAAPGGRSHAWFVQTNRGRPLWAPGSFCHQLGGVEGVPVLAFGEGGGLGADPLEVRYEFNFVRVDAEQPPTVWPVLDAHFCSFWFLQDPSILRPVPSLNANPLILVPDREGLALSAQGDLPHLPDGVVQETVARPPSSRIDGVTGYSRSWPAMTAPRRQWQLMWSRLRDSERATLTTFLRSNPTFRWRPPESTGNVAAAVVERPRWSMVDTNGPLWSLQLRVVELVHLAP